MKEYEKKARARYIAKAYDTITIRQPKGWRDKVKRIAENQGKSLAGFIREAVSEKLERSDIK